MTSVYRIENFGGIRGRGLTAARDIAQGTLILREGPFAFTPSLTCWSTHCAQCFRSASDASSSSSLMECTGCRRVRYCSSACQRADWTQWHRLECKFLKSMHPRNPPSLLRLLYRICILRQMKPEKYHSMLRNLTNHRDKMPSERLTELAQFVAILMKYAPDLEQLPSASELLDWLCIMFTNGFAIYDSTLTDVAYGLYPLASSLNHSCAPNATVVFDGSEMKVVAVRDIRQGEEITHHYMDVMTGRRMRRKELLDRYFFLCECSRCMNPHGSLNEPNEAYRCQQAHCTGLFSLPDDYLDMLEQPSDGMSCILTDGLNETIPENIPDTLPPLNIECPKCRMVHMAFENTVRLVLVSRRNVMTLRRQDTSRMPEEERIRTMAKLKAAHDCQAKYLSADHYDLFQTRRLLMGMYGQHALWEEALALCDPQLKTLKRAAVHLPLSPVLGSVYVIKARLCNWLNRFGDSMRCLKKASAILEKTGSLRLQEECRVRLQEIEAIHSAFR